MEPQPSKLQPESQRHGLFASREQNIAFDAQYRRDLFREMFHKFRSGFPIAFVALSPVLIILACSIITGLKRSAILNTPAKQGQAYIVSKRTYTTGSKGPIMHYEADFRLNGKTITAETIYPGKWFNTLATTTVSVTYHVGDNGEILISDWQTTPVK